MASTRATDGLVRNWAGRINIGDVRDFIAPTDIYTHRLVTTNPKTRSGPEGSRVDRSFLR